MIKLHCTRLQRTRINRRGRLPQSAKTFWSRRVGEEEITLSKKAEKAELICSKHRETAEPQSKGEDIPEAPSKQKKIIINSIKIVAVLLFKIINIFNNSSSVKMGGRGRWNMRFNSKFVLFAPTSSFPSTQGGSTRALPCPTPAQNSQTKKGAKLCHLGGVLPFVFHQSEKADFV